MTEVSPEIQAQLSALSEQEWSALSAKVRAPDSSEALRAFASQFIDDEDRLDGFLSAANVSAFVGADGQIDAEKATRLLAPLFGQPSGTMVANANWGQNSGTGPARLPGAGGRAAAAKRHGTPMLPGDETVYRSDKGAAGKAAAEARFNRGQQEGQR